MSQTRMASIEEAQLLQAIADCQPAPGSDDLKPTLVVLIQFLSGSHDNVQPTSVMHPRNSAQQKGYIHRDEYNRYSLTEAGKRFLAEEAAKPRKTLSLPKVAQAEPLAA